MTADDLSFLAQVVRRRSGLVLPASKAHLIEGRLSTVMRRFGFVKPNAETEAVYDAVMQAAGDMSAEDLYEFHWHLKRLGQNTCKAFQTSCNACPLSESCLKRMDAPMGRSGRAA